MSWTWCVHNICISDPLIWTEVQVYGIYTYLYTMKSLLSQQDVLLGRELHIIFN
jgi:hypothetical protein